MKPAEALRFYAATDVGRARDHNEDNFLVDKKLGVFVVCDGMGGHAAGEVASALAVRTFHGEIRSRAGLLERYTSGPKGPGRITSREVIALMEHAVQVACARVHAEAQTDSSKRGMGTTLSSLLIRDQQGFIAHVGDSRIYLLRGDRIEQITEDHTVFNELVKRGKLPKEQVERIAQKHAITRAVGVYERVDVDTLVIEVLPGDVFLIASDGLTGYLQSPEELKEFLPLEGSAATRSLVDLANQRGGKDNITVVVVKVEGEATNNDPRAQRIQLKREALAKMPIFSRLNERELLRVMQTVQVRRFGDGEPVIREGEMGDELFIVLSGEARVVRSDSTFLSTFGPGEHFGEMALLRNSPRSATVVAQGEAEFISIKRSDFFDILRKEHEIAVKILWQFLGVLADRLDQTSSELQQARAELHPEIPSVDVFPALELESVPASGPPLESSSEPPPSSDSASTKDSEPEGSDRN